MMALIAVPFISIAMSAEVSAQKAIENIAASLYKNQPAGVKLVQYISKKQPSTLKPIKQAYFFEISTKNDALIDQIMDAFRKEASQSVSFESSGESKFLSIKFRSGRQRSNALLYRDGGKWIFTFVEETDGES